MRKMEKDKGNFERLVRLSKEEWCEFVDSREDKNEKYIEEVEERERRTWEKAFTYWIR